MGVDAMDGTVSWQRRDIRINFTELDSPFYVKLSEEIRSLEQKSGKRIYHPKNATTIHPIGGACLGATIENGVINNNGEVFGYPGMYITDGSALPQEPGGPPSLTIAAWSSYVASRFIAKRFANI
jgi:cholesterol oxidase